MPKNVVRSKTHWFVKLGFPRDHWRLPSLQLLPSLHFELLALLLVIFLTTLDRLILSILDIPIQIEKPLQKSVVQTTSFPSFLFSPIRMMTSLYPFKIGLKLNYRYLRAAQRMIREKCQIRPNSPTRTRLFRHDEAIRWIQRASPLSQKPSVLTNPLVVSPASDHTNLSYNINMYRTNMYRKRIYRKLKQIATLESQSTRQSYLLLATNFDWCQLNCISVMKIDVYMHKCITICVNYIVKEFLLSCFLFFVHVENRHVSCIMIIHDTAFSNDYNTCIL